MCNVKLSKIDCEFSSMEACLDTSLKPLLFFSYRQCFDLEGEFGIVVRGIGTSVTLARLPSTPPGTPSNPLSLSGELSASHGQESG